MEVIVVGGGIYGQVIAWSLARVGTTVSVLEPVGAGHGRSGSGDRSRIVRGLYGDATLAEAGVRSLALWDEYTKKFDVDLIDHVGVLYFERTDTTPDDLAFAEDLTKGVGHLNALGADVVELTPSEIERRYPGVSSQGLRRAVLETNAGIGRAARATRTLARASTATGFATMRALRVTAIEPADRVRVDCYDDLAREAHVLEADAVVIAAGFDGVALAAPLLDEPLPIRRIPQYVTYWDIASPEAERLGRGLPAWAELGGGLYGMPDDGEAGFKLAWHEPRLDEALVRGEPTEADLEALRARGERRFPGLARARLRSTYACAYDATPNEGFVIGTLPKEPRITFVGGMSGHGFKHAPILGESVADQIIGKKPRFDLSPFGFDRIVRPASAPR